MPTEENMMANTNKVRVKRLKNDDDNIEIRDYDNNLIATIGREGEPNNLYASVQVDRYNVDRVLLESSQSSSVLYDRHENNSTDGSGSNTESESNEQCVSIEVQDSVRDEAARLVDFVDAFYLGLRERGYADDLARTIAAALQGGAGR